MDKNRNLRIHDLSVRAQHSQPGDNPAQKTSRMSPTQGAPSIGTPSIGSPSIGTKYLNRTTEDDCLSSNSE